MPNWLTSKPFFIILGPCLFVLAILIGGPDDMSKTAFAVVACTLWIALWWLVEAVPIGITSLLPLLLFPFCGVMPVAKVADYYSNPIIFLFIGGFIIALAMQRWNLHKRIALHIIRVSGTNQNQILLGFIMATGFLSMWISNTATTMMMLPIALSIISQLASLSDRDAQNGFGKALVMSIAFSASIGGMATLVGTPTTLIFVEGVRDFYNVEVPFADWFFFASPLVILLGAFLWWHMGSNAFKLSRENNKDSKAIIDLELQQLGSMKYEEKWILLVFSAVALAWMSRQYLINPFFPEVTDTSIALIGAFILFVIPSRDGEQGMIMDWATARNLPWAVILLFGGAFAVAGSFMESGLTEWIGLKLSMLQNVPHWVILLVIVTVVNYLTELTQNMATCTLMLPILAGLAFTIGVHPFALMVPMTIAASCAFMLPVATAPNAIIFGVGDLHIKDMVRAGWLMNIVSIILITVYTYYFLPMIWDIDVSQFPVGWEAN